MEGLFIPIALFAALTVIISLFYWFRFRSRQEMQQTIRAAIEKGQQLSPELIETLGQDSRQQKVVSKDKDLRYALIWLAIAASFVLFGVAMRSIEEEVLAAMLAIAAFPGMIGVAYLIMWRFTERAQ